MALKETRWHGKTEEEARKLDLREFMQLVPARPRRSLKRGFTDLQKRLLRKIERNEPNLRTQCRDMVIIPAMLGKMILVHRGKEFLPVTITVDMLGHYLGEFIMTRKPVSHSAAGIGATRSSKAISAR
ncbi:MAG: 30S ribosomal protein S19 [Nanoarchaeota archaeon]